MEHAFRVNGKDIRRTREQVIEALRGVEPARIRTHSVRIGGVVYPVKQAFGVAFGLDHAEFGTQTARRLLGRMGFCVRTAPRRPRGADSRGRPALKPSDEMDAMLPASVEVLAVAIVLEWSWWEWWTDIEQDDMTGAWIPLPMLPGVYEVAVHGEEQRLYIGRASNLNLRVKHALVKGTSEHPAGRKIAATEDLSRVCVRWAETDRPAAAEEELHRRHRQHSGVLPKYTQRT